MKTGRNQPCPCGSGKKYKKCCLGKNVTPPEALQYRRLSEVYDKVFPRLIEHGENVFGEAVVPVAMAEFLAWPEPDEAFDEDALARMDPLFWPWLVFNWEYDALEDEDGLLETGPEETTIAELYMQQKKIDPTSLEGRFLQAANRIQYSFHEVLAVDAGHTVTIRDVLTGVEILVQERAGSAHMHPGDILFGRAVSVDGVGMFLGLSAFVLPPRMKPDLIRLRRQVAGSRKTASAGDLYDWDLEIREVFLDMDAALHAMPTLVNTDGDPMEFHKLVYDIDDPNLAVKNLSDLSVVESYEEIVKHAEKTHDGKIRGASLDWSKPGSNIERAMPNTVLGNIEIDGARLTVSVNSAARAKTIRAEIDSRLGAAARFRLDEISDMDALFSHGAGNGGKDTAGGNEDLMALPEVQQHMAGMLQAHWEGWPNEPIPLLGGKTPRQAVKGADGRESVEALLRDAEKLAGNDPFRATFEPAMIADVRRQLKLNKPPAKTRQRASAEALAAAVRTVKSKIEGFGKLRLHDLYTENALRLCDAMAESAVLNLHRGRPEIWAAAIVCAIARLNFLFDPATPNHLTVDELAAWFGVKKPTMSNKASMIRDALNLFYNDERFCAPHVTRIFEMAEGEDGLIHPTGILGDADGSRLAPVPLKPPPHPRPNAAPAPEKTAKEKTPSDDRQRPLFPD